MTEQTRTIAYLRVFTTGQDLEKNRADILHLANARGLGQSMLECMELLSIASQEQVNMTQFGG